MGDISGIKFQGINIEHFDLKLAGFNFDIGTKGALGFVPMLGFGLLFYVASKLPLGELTQWFTLFYVLCFMGAAVWLANKLKIKTK